MRDKDQILLENAYIKIVEQKLSKIALIGVVKNFIDLDSGDVYKEKLEVKDITKNFNPKGDYLNQHDTYWQIENNYDDQEYIDYDRWKYNFGFGGSWDGVLMWTETPSEKSKDLVLNFLKNKFNITPEREVIWTRYLETERQRLKLRDISGD
jgi:hypothetical protein